MLFVALILLEQRKGSIDGYLKFKSQELMLLDPWRHHTDKGGRSDRVKEVM